jgi:hypothetical protein
VWTYETISDLDPAQRLNELMHEGATVEILVVLPSHPDGSGGGLLIRYSGPDPPLRT